MQAIDNNNNNIHNNNNDNIRDGHQSLATPDSDFIFIF